MLIFTYIFIIFNLKHSIINSYSYAMSQNFFYTYFPPFGFIILNCENLIINSHLVSKIIICIIILQICETVFILHIFYLL